MADVPRYLPTYRQDELVHICTLARRGESLCLMGVAGVGKSNLVRILRSDTERKARYLGADLPRVRFAGVDINRWQETPVHLWHLMLGAVQDAAADLPPPPTNTVVPMSEEDRISQRLQSHVKWVCQNQQQQLVFVFDDCDRLLTSGPLSMINNLNALRDDGNPGKLSYLLFTKRLPHVLGRNIALGASKFYDLIKRSVFALGLYSLEDARQMVDYLNAQAGSPLKREDRYQVEFLGGNHSGLIRTVFETWLQTTPDRQNYTRFFAAQPDIQAECQRILRGLHDAERISAVRFTQGNATPEDSPFLEHLMRRGLLTESNPPQWFSPLMAPVIRASA
jgi:hypothetical protein